MTVSAADVAAVLRTLLPDVPIKKLHKLLYYCQGHHLATFGVPLFHESVSAWDMGPVVGRLWYEERQGYERRAVPRPSSERESTPLGEAEFNTIGYVLSRYGSLTGQDLENLSHSESPWLAADQGRRPGESVRIPDESMRDYFRTDGAPDAGGLPIDQGQVARMLVGAEERRRRPARPDSIDELRARLSRSA